VVTALGYGTTGLSVGQRVFGLADWHRDGTLAECRRCPDRPAASYQPRRGQPGKLPMAPGIRCRTSFLSLEHIQQRDK
jgi:NADPH:quinone reductase-like Zn-dependent oxidoreductase